MIDADTKGWHPRPSGEAGRRYNLHMQLVARKDRTEGTRVRGVYNWDVSYFTPIEVVGMVASSMLSLSLHPVAVRAISP
jgi:hypothetical protein